MSKKIRSGGAGGLFAGFLLSSMVVLSSEAVASRRAPSAAAQDSEFEITAELLGSIVSDALPLVRETLGVKLEALPVRLGTRAEIKAALVAENTRIFVGLGIEPAKAPAEARAFAASIAPFLLAKYAFEDNEVLVQAGAFGELALMLGIPELDGEAALRGVLLHELIHAADDERHDMMELFLGCDSADSLRVCNALIEGHAQLVARDLAADLGWTEGFETYTGAINGPPKNIAEERGAGAELVQRTLTSFMAFSYIAGESFFAGLRADGGQEAVLRAFTHPPRDPILIANPEWFLHPERRPRIAFEIDPALEEFSDAFDPDEWTLRRLSVSPTDLPAAMAPLPAEEVEVLAKTMRQSRVQVASLNSSMGATQVIMGAFEFGSPAEAAAYLDGYRKLQKARDELMKEGAVRIVSADYEALSAPDPEGILVEKRVFANVANIDIVALCVTRGPLAVEALATNAEDWDIDELLTAAVEVLERIMSTPRAAEAGKTTPR